MLKQYCVCTGEGDKPPTTFVSLSEVLILQQYVKWSGGRVERGESGGLQWKFEVVLSLFIHYHPPPLPHRKHSRMHPLSHHGFPVVENKFASERYETRTADRFESHEI